MAKHTKRGLPTPADEDSVNIGKKAKMTRIRSRSNSKATVTKQQTVQSVAERVKHTPKRGKPERFAESKVIDNNINAVSAKSVTNKSVKQVQSKKRYESKQKTGKICSVKSIHGDGILVDVDDSEYNEEVDPADQNDETEMSDIEEDVTLGATASTSEENEEEKARRLLVEHPELKHLINSMLDERMKDVSKGKEATGNCNIENNVNMNTPVQGQGQNVILNKSPSDTTLYRPIFRRQEPVSHNNDNRGVPGDISVINEQQSKDKDNHNIHENVVNRRMSRNLKEDDLLKNKISDFVDSLRTEFEEQSTSRMSEMVIPGQDDARQKVDRTVIEAEKFKATIANPPGKDRDDLVLRSKVAELRLSQPVNENDSNDLPNSMDNYGKIDDVTVEREKSDDDFFHLTCHVDPTLISKIESGEFVDLERLLPKDRFGSRPSSEQKLEWIKNEDGTFLVPSNDRSTKINSFKRWEQAFRVYATVYCGANPSRSKEIWQYVSVISTAASSFVWDNVANYDYTFRQLMAFNPKRSWAITYHHMWSLAMKDPLPKNHVQRQVNYFGGGGSSGSNGNITPRTPQSTKKQGSKKWTKSPTYCWSFNRGLKCKYGSNCRYIERCSFCDATTHGVNVCPKMFGSGSTPSQTVSNASIPNTSGNSNTNNNGKSSAVK